MAETIIVDISKEGEVQMEVNGLKGRKCTDITKMLEKALGTVTKREHTQEFYQQNTNVVPVNRK